MREKALKISAKDNRSIVLQYLHLTRSLHRLTDVEMEVLSCLIEHYILCKGDAKEMLSYDNRVRIREELSISEGKFNTTLSRLRRKKAITDLGPNRNYIVYPDKEGLTVTFRLCL